MQGKRLSKTLCMHRSVHLCLIGQLFCLQSRPQSRAERSAAPDPAAHTHGHAGASTRTHHHLHSSLMVQLEPFWVPPQCCEDAVIFLFHGKPPTASHRGFAHTSKHVFVLQWEHQAGCCKARVLHADPTPASDRAITFQQMKGLPDKELKSASIQWVHVLPKTNSLATASLKPRCAWWPQIHLKNTTAK